jgi:hypothetical protein
MVGFAVFGQKGVVERSRPACDIGPRKQNLLLCENERFRKHVLSIVLIRN